MTTGEERENMHAEKVTLLSLTEITSFCWRKRRSVLDLALHKGDSQMNMYTKEKGVDSE